MTRIHRLEEARRGALKELVRLAHGAAAGYGSPTSDTPPSADQLLIATQLRRFADLVDAVATKGTHRMLAVFFEGPSYGAPEDSGRQ